MIFLQILFIQLICVFVIDISGFIDSLKLGISKALTHGKIPTTDFRMRPFDCSLCSTVWTSLIYILCVHQFSLALIAYILFLAILTPITKDAIVLFKDICIYIMNKIYDKMK